MASMRYGPSEVQVEPGGAPPDEEPPPSCPPSPTGLEPEAGVPLMMANSTSGGNMLFGPAHRPKDTAIPPQYAQAQALPYRHVIDPPNTPLQSPAGSTPLQPEGPSDGMPPSNAASAWQQQQQQLQILQQHQAHQQHQHEARRKAAEEKISCVQDLLL